MIQRKQTLFLLLVIIASALMFFFPLAEFIGIKDSLVLSIQSVHSLVPDHEFPKSLSFVLPLLAGNLFVIVFSFITIFLFKNRKRQMHIIRLNILVEVLFIGLFFLFYVGTLEKVSGGDASYKAGIFMPLIALVFLVLAYFGVLHDEKLVRSADRLR
jgi:glucan phosphoethanolaminetransferase (alkaline phosphatase superfamily)